MVRVENPGFTETPAQPVYHQGYQTAQPVHPQNYQPAHYQPAHSQNYQPAQPVHLQNNQTGQPAFIEIPWSTQLFDCHLDPTNAILTALFPCVTFGHIAEVLDQGQLTSLKGSFMYLLLMPALWSNWLLGSKYRSKLRARYHLVEAPYQDSISHVFCAFCSLCQEYRELKLRGLDPSLGWNGIKAQMEMQRRNQTMNTPPQAQNMSF